MYTSSKPYFYGTGRRKKSVARVRIVPGTGVITINGKNIDEYFGLETLKLIVNQPFGVTGTTGKFDIIALVSGGGISGQAGAIRHGLARALVKADEAYKPALKAAGLLTRDPRMKERKSTVSKLHVVPASSPRDKLRFFARKLYFIQKRHSFRMHLAAKIFPAICRRKYFRAA